jgi:hypothetical protein
MSNSLKTENINFINVTAASGTENIIQAKSIEVIGEKITQNILPPLNPPAQRLPDQWNVPPKNHNFTGRNELLKQIKHHFRQESTPAILTAFHGLGGIGKTQVALEFAWQYYEKQKEYKSYQGICWFNAENEDKLTNDYMSLGLELNIVRVEEKTSTEECIRYVKHWLEHPSHAGWLLVYDNALNYEVIQKFLPTTNGKIIVTSRYTEGWPQQSLRVDVFTTKESRDYIKKVLGIPLSENDWIQIDTLAETLGYLPLALAIVCSYIKKNKLSISRYLELYEKRKQELLSKTKSQLSDFLLIDLDEGKQFTSVYITWDITMDAVSK